MHVQCVSSTYIHAFQSEKKKNPPFLQHMCELVSDLLVMLTPFCCTVSHLLTSFLKRSTLVPRSTESSGDDFRL